MLDANVLLSSLVRRVTAPSAILDLWQNESTIEMVTSEHILRGVQRALAKPYWSALNGSGELSLRLDQFVLTVETIEPVDDVHGVAEDEEDEEDDLVLATAVAARADYLVTGDRYLLAIGEFRGIPIVSPREFLDRIGTEFA